jgi:osmotically-inducible protein OsmY
MRMGERMRASAMRRAFGMIVGASLLAGLAASLSGCVSLALGGAATVGVAASEDRGLGGALTDTRIRTDINGKWLNASMDVLQKVDLTVSEGRVHLTGTVPTAEMRLQAVKLVWQVEGVRQVIDDIEVGDDKSGVGDYARDVWISTRLRTDILFDRAIESVNYSVETVDGVVYLMGVAQNQTELDRVTDYARNMRYVKRVVSYARLKGQPVPATTQASGAAPAPGGAPDTAPPAAPAAAPPPPVPPTPLNRAPVEATPLASPARNPS